ncbi:nucleotidyltransferase family protein [candidate division KSB1 bacterium]|nr:nucleotidyltransferase family protein [candidate division KSB1 bacterium]RQW05602.1 MAG: nucleotidyltransferase family protein [candidate division KSB1 bacterium]
MKAIILAAGYATRLYPLTRDKPKPLLKIGDRTIIEYLLESFRAVLQLDRVFVVTNARFVSVFSQWADELQCASNPYPFEIVIVNDGTTSNETRLGAIADIQFVLQQENVDDDLIVAAGDNIFRFDMADLVDYFYQKNGDVILAQELDDPERLKTRGVVQFDTNLRVIGFEEKPLYPQSNYVCPAFYLHKRKNISLYKNYLNDHNNPDAPGYFIKWLFPRVPIHVFILHEPAIDIGTLETYERVCRELSN